jgi:cytochrome P450
MTRDAAPTEETRSPSDYTFPSPELQECPFPFYEALREQAPVHQIPGRHEYLVSRWEDITYIAEHPELFSSIVPSGATAGSQTAGEGQDAFSYFADGNAAVGAAGADDDFGYSPVSMAICDPPDNKMKRAVGLKLIGRERLREYEPFIRRYTEELIDSFIDRGEVEFVGEFSYWLPIKVIADVLGLPQDDLVLLKWLGDRAGQGTRFMTGEELEEENRASRALVEYLRTHILDRHENPRDDGLGQLVSGQVARDGRLNLPYLMSEAGVLLFAGNTTTAHMLSSAMMLLLQNSDQLEKVQSDRSLIRPLVEETLRVESPVQWTQRTTTQNVEIAGVEVPPGATLLVLWASGNRDPQKWEDPERFWLERPSIAKHHLAFGRGAHLCLGAPLARLEGDIAFNALFDRMTNFRLAPGKNDFTHVTVPHNRAPKVVHMQFDRIDA